MSVSTMSTLPGENAPLEMVPGRGPITEAEALGVARRLARREIANGRKNTKVTVPDELPAEDALRTSSLFRLPPRMMAFVKARAEMEGRTVTSVVEEALAAYGYGAPMVAVPDDASALALQPV